MFACNHPNAQPLINNSINMQGKAAECSTYSTLLCIITSTGSHHLSSFHELLPTPRPPRARFSTEPCGVDPSQRFGQLRLRPHLRHGPLTLGKGCQAPSAAGPQLPPTSTPAPSPLSCRHLSTRPRAKPDGGTGPAGKPPVRKKAEGQSPARPTPQPRSRRGRALGLCRRARGCAHVRVGASHLHLSETGARKPEWQDFACSLRCCKLCLALCYSTGKSAPKIYSCEPQPKAWMLQRIRFSRSKALFKDMASVIAGEERKT